MGNTFSSGNNVWVQSERPSYFGGDVVRGVVCLNLIKEVKTTGIDLIVKGKETVHWTESHTVTGGNNSRTETAHYSSSTDIFRVTVGVGSARTLAPGQYQLPFAFTLPPGIPPSTYFKGYSFSECAVRYTMKVVCHRPGMMTSDIKCKQEFGVWQPAWPQAPAPVRVTEDAVIKGCCCCFSLGRASLTASLGDQVLAAGEVVSALVDANNPSTARFKSMHAKLVQHIWMEGNVGSWGHHTRSENRTLAEVTTEGLAAHGSLQNRQLALQIPPPTQASLNGAHFRIAYSLEVLLKSRACVSDLKLIVPLTLIRAKLPAAAAAADSPPEPLPEPFALPPGAQDWQPANIFPPVQLQVRPDAPPVPPEALEPSDDFWARVTGAASAQAAKESGYAQLPSNKPAPNSLPTNAGPK